MLTLKNIIKNYTVGDTTVSALKGVSVEFRKSEFVSVLGPSGCGKTTLLNIIGGLDRYTSGDLIINGRSTKGFTDSDWDTYRNHSVGFVFQSYNLIPHQSVLSNVELALTLSGVSREERRRRAAEALEKVGLGDQLHKRPNQMSGGQMQRVAIARALVNDPDILLADEPTGALDSETSVQIMNILKEISSDKLIIMVTHNPELAEQYSSRIIRLLDGNVIDDTAPYDSSEERSQAEEQPKRTRKERRAHKKPTMSFFTAVSLSFNNLLTKKARTFLTSFAGSIGIIGIALIMALSNGVNTYITSVQEDTLASYPISVQAETVDASALLTTLMNVSDREPDHELDKVYGNTVMHEMVNSLNSTEVQQNNLKDFKKFLDKEMKEQTSKTGLYKYATAIGYSYDFDMNIYTKDIDGAVTKSDMETLISEVMGMEDTSAMSPMGGTGAMSMANSPMSTFVSMKMWNEMLPGTGKELVGDMLKEQYQVISGDWPENYNEVVLVVNEYNEVSDLCLYVLGLKTIDEIRSDIQKSSAGEELEIAQQSWSYEDIRSITFRLVPSSDRYTAVDGRYVDLETTDAGMKYLYDNGIELKVSGIIRLKEGTSGGMLQSGTIAYTSALTDEVVKRSNNSDIVKAQLENTDVDIITGKKFKPAVEPTEDEKVLLVKEYIDSLDTVGKAALYRQIAAIPDDTYLQQIVEAQFAAMSADDKVNMLIAAMTETGMSSEQATQYIEGLDEATIDSYVTEALSAMVTMQYAESQAPILAAMADDEAAAKLEAMLTALDQAEDKTELVSLYDSTIQNEYSQSDYEANLKTLGYVDMESPDTINIYAATFKNKDFIADIISDYNKQVKEEDRITYTDYVAQIMKSVTTIINAISYVLMAFVSISLVVSSIMIGIITYISVLERTKEIGVLRSIGASKRDISRVFNAETLIIGFASGAIGIIVTVLLCIPINIIIHALTDISTINASLPVLGGAVLVVISMVLTFVAGLIPSRIAARKDPVEALRSE